MTLEEARRICNEVIEKYGSYCDYQEERRDGEIKFINLTLRFKIEQTKYPNKSAKMHSM